MEIADSFGIYIPTLPNTTIKLSSLVETMVNDGTVEPLQNNGSVGPFAVTLVRKKTLDDLANTRDCPPPSVNDVLEIMLNSYRRALRHLVSDKPKNMTIQGFNTHKNASNLSMRVTVDSKTKQSILDLGRAFTLLGYTGIVMPNNTLHLSLAKFTKEIKEPKDKKTAIELAESLVPEHMIHGNSCNLGRVVIGETYDSPHPNYEEFLEQHKI